MAAKKANTPASNKPTTKPKAETPKAAAGTPDIAAQIKRTQEEIAKKGGNAPNLQKRLAELQGQAGGLMSAPPTKDDKFTGLSGDQNQILNQMETGDVNIGNTANQQLDDIQNNYSKPTDWSQFGQMPQGPDWSQMSPAPQPMDFSGMGQRPDVDWSGVPQGPVSGDFNNWRQQQIDSTYGDFTKRMEPQFQQQSKDFEQQMANRGIPIGSDLYNRQLKDMQTQQSDARNSAMVQAQGIAGQNAQQFAGVGFQANSQGMQNAISQWDVGNQGYNNKFNDITGKYGAQQGQYQDQFGNATNMYNAQLGAYNNNIQNYQMQKADPLNNYNQLKAAQSPMGMQNLSYSQQQGLNNQTYQQQLGLIKATPHGGGGGGGGSPSVWQQYGFSSPQEYDAYKNANTLFMNQQNLQMQQQYQPKGPSSGALIGGQLLGTGLALGGNYAFS